MRLRTRLRGLGHLLAIAGVYLSPVIRREAIDAVDLAWREHRRSVRARRARATDADGR